MKKKISLIFAFAIIFLALISSKCFAVDFNSLHYLEVTGLSMSGRYRICCNEDFYLLPESGYFSAYSIATDNRVNVTLYRYDVDNTYSDYYKHEVSAQFISVTNNLSFPDSNGNVIVYKDSSKTDFFFKAPPLVAQAVERVGQVRMKAVIQEIVAIVPVILSVLVSLLALRKGLRLLLSFLKTS